MKHITRSLLATGAAALTLATFASTAQADARGDTPDGKYWYIGTGNAYGQVKWLDKEDDLWLDDDAFPSGYSVSIRIENDGKVRTAHAYHDEYFSVDIPGTIENGEKARFKACAWDNGDVVYCRPWTTVIE